MPTQDVSEAERIASLSEKQIDSLRLTFAHKSSKEIALMRGVTKFAIDAQIERAMRTLGASSRIEAARMVMRHAGAASDRIVYDPPGLAGVPSGPANPWMSDDPAASDEDRVAELPAPYLPPPERLAGLPRQRSWGNPDDLAPMMRAGLIAAVAFFLLSTVFTLLLMGERASDWVTENIPGSSQPNN